MKKVNAKFLRLPDFTSVLIVVLASSGIFASSSISQSAEGEKKIEKSEAAPVVKPSGVPVVSSESDADENADDEDVADDDEEEGSTAKSGKLSHVRGCIVDEVAVQDLKDKKNELDSKEKALAKREAEISAKEKALKDELAKIEDAQKILEGKKVGKKAQDEEKVNKIVETMESMSPKAAATLIANVDEELALLAMTRISTPKLAKVMNLIEPGKAARLSESMAGVQSARNSVKTQSERGGEKTNGQSKPIAP